MVTGHSVACHSQAQILISSSMATSPRSDRATSLARRGGSRASPVQVSAHNSSKRRRTNSQSEISVTGHSVACHNGEMAVLPDAPSAPARASQGAEAPSSDAEMAPPASNAGGDAIPRSQSAMDQPGGTGVVVEGEGGTGNSGGDGDDDDDGGGNIAMLDSLQWLPCAYIEPQCECCGTVCMVCAHVAAFVHTCMRDLCGPMRCAPSVPVSTQHDELNIDLCFTDLYMPVPSYNPA